MPADIRCIRSFSHTQRRLVVIGMTSFWQWAKNFGMCHMKKHNFEEAMVLLRKAQQVADRELEENLVENQMESRDKDCVGYIA